VVNWTDEELLAYATDNGAVDFDMLYVSSHKGLEGTYLINYWQLRNSVLVSMISMGDNTELERAAVGYLLRRGCPHFMSPEEEEEARLEKQRELLSGKQGY
jgi:hypothetical protein